MKIDSGPVDAQFPACEYDQSKWPELMRQRKCFIRREITKDCRCLSLFIRETEEMHKVCGFTTAEEMIQVGYELDPEEIALTVKWLERNDPDEPVPYQHVLAQNGGDRRSVVAVTLRAAVKAKNQPDNVRVKYGNSKSYAHARLERDYPELAAEVTAGTKSANEAATEAGFRPKVITLRIDTAENAVKRLVKIFGIAALDSALEQYRWVGRNHPTAQDELDAAYRDQDKR